MKMDVLMGVDPRMLHGGDMRSLFTALGDSKSFWGGVNAEVTLRSEDPELIDKAVRDAVECLGGNGGLVVGSFILQQLTTKAVLLLIDSWRKYNHLCNPMEVGV